MRLALVLVLALLTSSASAAELFRTNVGTGPYDSWKYGYYESELLFHPERTMYITAVKPSIFSCLGECTYRLTIKSQNGSVIAQLIEREAGPERFDGILNAPVTLEQGGTYTFTMRIDSSKDEIGIYTAGSAPFPNRTGPASLELIYARKGSNRYTERGPIAFTLRGDIVSKIPKATVRRRSRISRIERVRARREARLMRRNILHYPTYLRRRTFR